jgi:hypothetical protein
MARNRETAQEFPRHPENGSPIHLERDYPINVAKSIGDVDAARAFYDCTSALQHAVDRTLAFTQNGLKSRGRITIPNGVIALSRPLDLMQSDDTERFAFELEGAGRRNSTILANFECGTVIDASVKTSMLLEAPLTATETYSLRLEDGKAFDVSNECGWVSLKGMKTAPVITPTGTGVTFEFWMTHFAGGAGAAGRIFTSNTLMTATDDSVQGSSFWQPFFMELQTSGAILSQFRTDDGTELQMSSGALTANQPVHVATTFDGSTGTARLFIDGTLVSTVTGGSEFLLWEDWVNFTIGNGSSYVFCYGNGAPPADIRISSIRITNRALYSANFTRPGGATPAAHTFVDGQTLLLMNFNTSSGGTDANGIFQPAMMGVYGDDLLGVRGTTPPAYPYNDGRPGYGWLRYRWIVNPAHGGSDTPVVLRGFSIYPINAGLRWDVGPSAPDAQKNNGSHGLCGYRCFEKTRSRCEDMGFNNIRIGLIVGTDSYQFVGSDLTFHCSLSGIVAAWGLMDWTRISMDDGVLPIVCHQPPQYFRGLYVDPNYPKYYLVMLDAESGGGWSTVEHMNFAHENAGSNNLILGNVWLGSNAWLRINACILASHEAETEKVVIMHGNSRLRISDSRIIYEANNVTPIIDDRSVTNQPAAGEIVAVIDNCFLDGTGSKPITDKPGHARVIGGTSTGVPASEFVYQGEVTFTAADTDLPVTAFPALGNATYRVDLTLLDGTNGPLPTSVEVKPGSRTTTGFNILLTVAPGGTATRKVAWAVRGYEDVA